MIIREATTDDSAAICQLTKRAFKLYADELREGTPVKALSETVDNVIYDINNNHVYVADDNGKIVGVIRYCHLTDELAYIYRFGVEPDTNNTGIGSDLINKVIDNCTLNGYKAIALHTNSKYYKLARYYYGKEFYVHSTSTAKGYIRALFIRELANKSFDIYPQSFDISPALEK